MLLHCPLDVTGQEGISLDRKTPVFTIKPASLDGGMYPRWRDGATIEYGNANKYFLYHTDRAKTTPPKFISACRAPSRKVPSR